MRQPDRTAGEEHRRQRHIEHERRVIAAAEAAADIGELGIDARRLERARGPRRADARSTPRLVGRLHAEHEFEAFAVRGCTRRGRFPARETSDRRLGLEFAIEHQQVRIFGREFSADLLAIDRGLGVGGLGVLCERRPDRKRRVLERPGADPAGQDRRIDIGRVGRRAGHAREAIGAVVRHRDRAGFLAEPHECPVAQGEPRLIEGVERLEDQQRRPAAPDRAASCRPGRTGRRYRIRERGCRSCRDRRRSPRPTASSRRSSRARSMPI